MERIYSLRDLSRRAREVVETILVTGEPAVVAGGGRPGVVILPRDEYLGLLHALDEMRRPDWQQIWEQANLEAETSQGRDWHEILPGRDQRVRSKLPRPTR